jgi:hypothetical protein
MTGPQPTPSAEVEAAIARVETYPVRNTQTHEVTGYMLRADEWREIRAALRAGMQAARDEERARVLGEVERRIADQESCASPAGECYGDHDGCYVADSLAIVRDARSQRHANEPRYTPGEAEERYLQILESTNPSPQVRAVIAQIRADRARGGAR